MKKQSMISNEMKKLQYQLSYSQYINKQISEQLTILQQRTGMQARKVYTAQDIPLINTQKHLEQLYYVEPLLMAYQNKVKLTESQLRQLNETYKQFSQYAVMMVAQNNYLRKQLEGKLNFIIKNEDSGINVNYLKLEVEGLKEKNGILSEKNKFIEKQLIEKNEEIDKEKIMRREPEQQLQNKLMQIKILEGQNRNQQIELLELKKKLNININQLNNEKSQQKQQSSRINELQNQIIKLKNQLKIQQQKIDTYQLTCQGKYKNLQTQIETLKGQLKTVQRRQNQLFNKNMTLQNEIQDKSGRVHNLNLQNTQLQTNNNNILQIVQSYEVKVNSHNKKIKTTEAELKNLKQENIEQQKELEMLQWQFEEKQKQVENKEIQMKKQRERINKMWEDRITALRRAIEEEKDTLHQEIHTLKSEKVKWELRNGII